MVKLQSPRAPSAAPRPLYVPRLFVVHCCPREECSQPSVRPSVRPQRHTQPWASGVSLWGALPPPPLHLLGSASGVPPAPSPSLFPLGSCQNPSRFCEDIPQTGSPGRVSHAQNRLLCRQEGRALSSVWTYLILGA